jgi:ATP-dependent DNA ligase
MVTRQSDGFVPPCIPSRAHKPPAGAAWVHVIKHDGYWRQVRREGDTVRLFTRRGYDWSGRYPAIVLAATRLRRARSFTLDGERSFAVRMGSRSSTRCTAAAWSVRPCCMHSTSWSSTARTSALCR